MKKTANVSLKIEIPNEEAFREYVSRSLDLEIADIEDAITELIASWVIRGGYDMNFPDIRVLPIEITIEEDDHDSH